MIDMEPQDGEPLRQTAMQRRGMPNFYDIALATAEKFGVCKRPIPMRVYDPRTLTEMYVATPCKATIASTCAACAKAARAVRVTQCYEGWHLDAEPVDEKPEPTEWQVHLLTARANLLDDYQAAKAEGDEHLMDGIRELVADLDAELHDTGWTVKLAALDPLPKKRRIRSTKRRQDMPDLPRKKVSRTTIGEIFAGKYRPSMMITLTLPSYGKINPDGGRDKDGKPASDGSPRDPDTYDYQSAARDIVHFAALRDRFKKNLRRCVGWNVQYWEMVEPQKRGAPHVHMLIRGRIPREVVKQVARGTYHQVWWPYHDAENEVYGHGRMPVWDNKTATFVDPDTKAALPGFDDARDNLKPAHVIKFGAQIDPKHIKGVIGGTQEAARTIGYVTKYLTKSIAEVLEPQSARAAVHYDRLHAELQHTPCSETCAVWLRFGIVPQGATEKTIPGRCRGKAHRRDTLGLPGRRVLNSRKWTGKTLADHKADRVEFVRQLLGKVGMTLPETDRLQITPVEPGDQHCPPRDQLIMAHIAQRTRWRAEYATRLLAASPPGTQQLSAIREAA
ncbi:helitron helicase-like domain-containing protein [Nocardia sp. JCM 34519.1]|uniref:helitron helicase-like domain-containing protein n=4 Tax=unclassified Nocardia TaxID=2637762 RepID=UPI001CE453CC|nr:helitron helicase-like domain-containing protein [Nocardia sp. JCM 34519.1]